MGRERYAREDQAQEGLRNGYGERTIRSTAEQVLVAWGLSTEGPAVLVGLEADAGESTDAWSPS